MTTINLSKIISKKERKKFFKIFFGILSGMSYANSLFSVMVNFAFNENKKHNYKLAIKAFLYSNFNPGGGFLISSVVLMGSCKCSNEEDCDRPSFIISLIGILFSIFLMVCPIIICIGIYLLKITESITDLYPIKFTILFIGIIGTILSFSFSFIKKNAIINSYREDIKPFDIVFKFGESFINLKSKFGFKSLSRIFANTFFPGS